MRIYVASSWRNQGQPLLVRMLRSEGHAVYDFRNPRPGNDGFRWSEIDTAWQSWTSDEFRSALKHPVAQAGFASDFDAMRDCDACVLLLPSGRSAHLEAGWFIGQGKPCAVLLAEGCEPELMYSLAAQICVDVHELLAWAARRSPA